MDPSAVTPVATPTRKRRRVASTPDTVPMPQETTLQNDTPPTPVVGPALPVPDPRPRVAKPFDPCDMFPPRYERPHGLCGPSRVLKGTYVSSVDSPVRPPYHLQHRVGPDFCEEVTRIQQEVSEMADTTHGRAQNPDEKADNPELVGSPTVLPVVAPTLSSAQNTSSVPQPADTSTYAAGEGRWNDFDRQRDSSWYGKSWDWKDWNYSYTWESGSNTWDSNEWDWDYDKNNDWHSWKWGSSTDAGHWTKTPEGGWEWTEKK